MAWSKLKNIIILLLLSVNVFLLVLVFVRHWESDRHTKSAREDALAILWETGRIQVDSDSLPEEMTLQPLSVVRDPALEQAQAQALLGQLSQSPADSMRYAGERGTAQFYMNGEFFAEFYPGAYPLSGASPEAFTTAFLEQMQVYVQVQEVTEQEGVTAVTVCQMWENVPIFDCTAVILFWDGDMRGIQKDSSYRLMGTPEPGDSSNTRSLLTMLLDFLEYVNQNALVCNEIRAFTPGYTMDVRLDAVQLVPAWHVTTDQGEYYWNTQSGEIWPVQAGRYAELPGVRMAE